MPRLNKRPPESRSEKRERLTEQDRQDQLAQAQQRQQHQEEAQFFKEWHSLFGHRLDSEEAYAHFEAFYRQHIGRLSRGRIHNPDVFLTIYRYGDGKLIDPEFVVNSLEREPNQSVGLLHIAKQLAFKGVWSELQILRLQEVVLRHLQYDGWHRSLHLLVRLARAITDDGFEARARLLLPRRGPSGEMIAILLAHLEQERKMRVSRTRKG